MRFAGARAGVRELLSKIIPFANKEISNREAASQMLWRFLPDVGFAGLTAVSAPEGTDASTRALIGLEDLGWNVGGSILGQMGGFGAGKAFARARAKRGGEASHSRVLDNFVTGGDMLGQALAGYYGRRPVLEGAIEDWSRNQQEEQAALTQVQEQEQLEQLANALMATGLIGVNSATVPAGRTLNTII